jgi:hypothetical protein
VSSFQRWGRSIAHTVSHDSHCRRYPLTRRAHERSNLRAHRAGALDCVHCYTRHPGAAGTISSIGAISGILVSSVMTVYYDSGFMLGLKDFVAAIVGARQLPRRCGWSSNHQFYRGLVGFLCKRLQRSDCLRFTDPCAGRPFGSRAGHSRRCGGGMRRGLSGLGCFVLRDTVAAVMQCFLNTAASALGERDERKLRLHNHRCWVCWMCRREPIVAGACRQSASA